MPEEQVPMSEVTPSEPVIKMFMVIGSDGKPQGFYPTDIYTVDNLPAGAVEITQEVWREFLSDQQFRKFSPEGELIVIPPPTQEELDAIEAARPRTDAEKIVALQGENINLMLALTQVYEEKEAEKVALEQESIDNMLAITELYEMIIGG
jgi:hypothetical protein